MDVTLYIEGTFMIHYRKILELQAEGISHRGIATSGPLAFVRPPSRQIHRTSSILDVCHTGDVAFHSVFGKTWIIHVVVVVICFSFCFWRVICRTVPRLISLLIVWRAHPKRTAISRLEYLSCFKISIWTVPLWSDVFFDGFSGIMKLRHVISFLYW